ncbi:uncharacterized protein TNCV_3560381 [Trichonephila clavipes]|uniref:Histone-lysine N-methyltransferase SETMAR n=1 Tax=Trichonephila clavipes TaxID=2585209 RepID=A0A8X6WD17_TRICX|nr:uncharacterized protein TNCV_3560381 [Trichonephila clavipes]
MDNPICYQLWLFSIAIGKYVKCYSPTSFPSLKASIGAIFLQDNARPHVAKTVPDFCSTQHKQLLPRPAYSLVMSPIQQVWHLVGWRLACDSRPAASKNYFCCAYKQYVILFYKQTLKICLTPCHVV